MTATPPRRRWWLAWFGVAIAALLALALRIGGDVWWPVFPLLFGPRWITTSLVLLPLPLLLTRPRQAILPLTLAVLLVGVGIMGFRIGPARVGLGSRSGTSLRLLEYNVAASGHVAHLIAGQLDSLGVDVAVLVECPYQSALVQPRAGWAMRSAGEICFLSRRPILDWQVRSQDDIWLIHGKASVAEARIDVAGQPVAIGMLHLKSPRDALIEFRYPSAFPTLGAHVDSISAIRNLESERATVFLATPDSVPLIVAGDFNTPVESRIFRRWWSVFSDAFERAGMGVGFTWHSRWYGLRIDHILTAHGVRAERTWIGPDLGSDHVPVIAELSIDRSQRTNGAR